LAPQFLVASHKPRLRKKSLWSQLTAIDGKTNEGFLCQDNCRTPPKSGGRSGSQQTASNYLWKYMLMDNGFIDFLLKAVRADWLRTRFCL
jgi:hypothetical protein